MSTKKKTIIINLVLLITVGIVGVVDASDPVTVIDDLGRTITIASFPERVVCISPSSTEIVYALGLGNKVVGVDIYSDYPPEAVAKQKINILFGKPNPEEVAALTPDLVIMYSYFGPGDPDVKAIEDLGLTVIALRPHTPNDILRDIRLVGNATGKPNEAEALASSISQKIDEITSKTSDVVNRPRVYIEYWYPPPWTYGPNTWGHQLIELAGGNNTFGDAMTEWVETTDEEVIARNPEVIISLYGIMHYATLVDMKKRPGWDEISAITNGKVYLVDENLFVRPGPRIIDGLEVLARILHPELLGEAGVSTFYVNATILKTATQTMNVTGLVTANIEVIKATGNCTLAVTALKAGPEAPANLKLVGNYLDVDSSIPIGFASIIRIYYTDEQLRTLGVSEDSLGIYTWDSEENKWVSCNSIVNKGENYVEGLVTHLSYFALMGEPELPFWELPVPLWLSILMLVIAATIAGTGAYVARKRYESVR